MGRSEQDNRKILAFKKVISEHFTRDNWLELGTLTSSLEIVRGHSRLLRSLLFKDEDYAGNVFDVLLVIADLNPANISIIERYISENFDEGGKSISSIENAGRKIYFTPSVFVVPDEEVQFDLISVMMPFDAAFDPVYSSLQTASHQAGMRCLRVKEIWQHSTVIQDIFSLIWRSYIVVCDFTGRNANVFYEAGIAHTLGKHVIPITQSANDVPFDLRHHRYLEYLNNSEGRNNLEQGLANRIRTLMERR